MAGVNTFSLELEEQLLDRRFQTWGADIVVALQRVFRRYGHFRPLLTHLQLASDGTLPEQQEILQRVLALHGREIFLRAIQEGRNPTAIALEQEFRTETGPAPLVGRSDVTQEAMACPATSNSGPVEETLRPPVTGEERRSGERRLSIPGRRMELNLMFEGCRRQQGCRRKGRRRASDQ